MNTEGDGDVDDDVDVVADVGMRMMTKYSSKAKKRKGPISGFIESPMKCVGQRPLEMAVWFLSDLSFAQPLSPWL